jgi:hypothetical protein
MDSYHIYSAMKYKYVGITDERNALTVDREDRLDHLLLPLNQTEAAEIFFKIRKESCLPCLMPPLLQSMAIRLQPCIDSSSSRTVPFPVRINVI